MYLEYDLFMKVERGCLDIVLSNISNPPNALGVRTWNSIPPSIKVRDSRINDRTIYGHFLIATCFFLHLISVCVCLCVISNN